MSDCSSDTTQMYLEVTEDMILNTSWYCNAVTRRQNLHWVEFMQVQYILKTFSRFFHCDCLGLSLSGRDLLLLILVLLINSTAWVMTLTFTVSVASEIGATLVHHGPLILGVFTPRDGSMICAQNNSREIKRCRQSEEQYEPMHQLISMVGHGLSTTTAQQHKIIIMKNNNVCKEILTNLKQYVKKQEIINRENRKDPLWELNSIPRFAQCL